MSRLINYLRTRGGHFERAGEEVQSQNQVLNLPNVINRTNIHKIIDGILQYNEGGKRIRAVKFSGFIGEPLVAKEATLRGIQRLSGAGIDVGLFTNGVLMTSETWDTLAQIKYVHVSLDAGPSSFFWVKEDQSKPYTNSTFEKVVENISGLNIRRLQLGQASRTKLNIGYVVIPGNHNEIYNTTKAVVDAGADSIRFKCDIGGKHDLVKSQYLDYAFDEIQRAIHDFHKPPNFSVYSIHSKSDVETKSYAEWQCKDGCYYQHFLATIGSDGNLYLCDHNTMPGSVALGNVIDHTFKDVWRSDQRKYISDGVKYTCQCAVCPPFGNRVNFFLSNILDLCNQYGVSEVLDAINEAKARLESSVAK